MKFGGSSVGEAACIQRVADIVESHHAAGDEVAVVVSACSGITDRIIAAADEAATSSEEPAIEEFISAMRASISIIGRSRPEISKTKQMLVSKRKSILAGSLESSSTIPHRNINTKMAMI